MKILTNDDGRPTFLPEEKRTAQQISSLFSRLTSTQRQRFADAEEISEEDIEAVKAEMALKDLRRLAIDDMEKTSHPIIVRGHNICELLKSNKLASLLFLSAQPTFKLVALNPEPSIYRAAFAIGVYLQTRLFAVPVWLVHESFLWEEFSVQMMPTKLKKFHNLAFFFFKTKRNEKCSKRRTGLIR